MSKVKLYVPSIPGRKVNVSILNKDRKDGESKYSTSIHIGDGGYKTDDTELQEILDNHELNGLANGFKEKELKGVKPDPVEEETEEEIEEEDEELGDKLSAVSNLNEARLYLIKHHDMSERVSNPETIASKAKEAGIVFPNFEFPES